MSALEHLSEPVKHAVDLLSIGAVVAALLNLLPAITALVTLLWISMRVIESWQNIKINGRKLKGDR